MRLSISQAAQRSGVSVRTLRYYDEIGLLKPSEVTPAGYRYYDVLLWKLCSRSYFTVSWACPWNRLAPFYAHLTTTGPKLCTGTASFC